VIKKIQIELIIFIILLANILLSYKADLLIYDYFYNLNYGLGTLYLKNFFTKVTELGDSLWYFLITLLIFVVSFVGKVVEIIPSRFCFFLRNLSIFSFVYLSFVGIATQILKHIIGRPRPNHADFERGFDFNFFSADASFHSFPSGHSSTIFAVTLIMVLLVPRLKMFFLFFGFVIALSRVVVGAHFATDIIAGGLLALISYKIVVSIFESHFTKISIKDLEIKNASLLSKTNIVFIIIGIFITVGHDFDIFFSSLFYYGNSQFFLQSYDALSIIFRDIFLPFLIFYLLVLPIIAYFLPINKLYMGHSFLLKELVFVVLTSLTALVLVVNIILKNLWGRTRPNDISQFEGIDAFSPWYKFGDVCVSNCSFVSGDASVGFALIMFYFITKKVFYVYLSVACGLCLGVIRIIAGGHFLSDVVFSQIVVTAVIFASYLVYKKISNE
tara:strand:- start:26527 stop:27855 length:1329 start_codon:yes stop_codon:yes gene_type:complete